MIISCSEDYQNSFCYSKSNYVKIWMVSRNLRRWRTLIESLTIAEYNWPRKVTLPFVLYDPIVKNINIRTR